MKILFVATALLVLAVAFISQTHAQLIPFKPTHINSTSNNTVAQLLKLQIILQQDNAQVLGQKLDTQNKLLNMIESDLHDIAANQTHK